MLDPQNDRLDYGTLLSPPPGHKLEAAVATTYSLDLAALMSVAMRLGVGLSENGELNKNIADVRLALDRVKDKLVIFCDPSGIKYPNLGSGKGVKSLYALLDRVVVPVRQKKGRDGIPSFHPKMWLICFAPNNGKGDCIWRFIVLSRNLTFDRSWDVVVAFEGQRAKKPSQISTFIAAFLGRVEKHADDRKNTRTILKKIVANLSAVDFAKTRMSNDFKLIETLGWVGKKNNDAWDASRFNAVFEDKYAWRDIAIVSPFLSTDIFVDIEKKYPVWQCGEGKAPPTRILITRRDVLEKLKENDVHGFTCYFLRDDAVADDEGSEEPESSESRFGCGLHAKMYFLGDGTHSELLVGSMNATHSGFYRNSEMLVRLASEKGFDVREFVKSLFCIGKDADVDEKWPPEPDNRCPFEKWTWNRPIEPESSSEKETNRKHVESVMRGLANARLSGKVEKEGPAESDKALYMEIVKVPEIKVPGKLDLEGTTVLIAPFCRQEDAKAVLLAGQERPLVFAGLSAESLSCFFVATVSKGCDKDKVSLSRVLRVEMEMDDKMENFRQDAVNRVVFGNKEAVSRYIQMLLSEDPDYTAGNDGGEGRISGEGVDSSPGVLFGGRYEEMMKLAVSCPERIREVASFIEKVAASHDLEGDDYREDLEAFKEMCETFGKAMAHTSRRGGRGSAT